MLVPLGDGQPRLGDLPGGRGRLRGGHAVVGSVVVPLRVGEPVRHEPLGDAADAFALGLLALLSLGGFFILRKGIESCYI